MGGLVDNLLSLARLDEGSSARARRRGPDRACARRRSRRPGGGTRPTDHLDRGLGRARRRRTRCESGRSSRICSRTRANTRRPVRRGRGTCRRDRDGCAHRRDRRRCGHRPMRAVSAPSTASGGAKARPVHPIAAVVSDSRSWPRLPLLTVGSHASKPTARRSEARTSSSSCPLAPRAERFRLHKLRSSWVEVGLRFVGLDGGMHFRVMRYLAVALGAPLVFAACGGGSGSSSASGVRRFDDLDGPGFDCAGDRAPRLSAEARRDTARRLRQRWSAGRRIAAVRFRPGGTPRSLPAGVDLQKLQSAIQACGGAAGGFPGGGQNAQAFQAYTCCLSDHGVKVPTADRDPGRRRPSTATRARSSRRTRCARRCCRTRRRPRRTEGGTPSCARV